LKTVEYFLFPLPTPYKVSASEFASDSNFFLQSPSVSTKVSAASAASSFRFHIPAPCFMKYVSLSGSSKSQMPPSVLPLPASFFKVLPLPHP